jgi:hypothetical protein
LDEALGLTVGPARIWLGEDLAQAQVGAGWPESLRPVARPIVCHNALNVDTELGVISNGGLKEGDSGFFALISHDLHEGDARSIVDADMDAFPADAMVTVDHAGLSSSDAMSNGTDAAEFLDIEVDELAGFSRS